MPPPGANGPGASARWNHVGEGSGSVSHALVQQVVKAAREEGVLLTMSANKLNRLVRSYFADRTTTKSFGQWVIAYADPTGETAVRNVMRERCSA